MSHVGSNQLKFTCSWHWVCPISFCPRKIFHGTSDPCRARPVETNAAEWGGPERDTLGRQKPSRWMFFRSQKYSGCHAPQDASINTRKGWSVWRWTNESDTDILRASTRKELDIFPLKWPRAKKELVLQFFAWPLRPHCYLIISGVFPDGWSGKRTVLRNVEPFRRKQGLILSCMCII